MPLIATVEVRSNIKMVMRERGKIVARRDTHNIWLNLGRGYLAQLIAYQQITPSLVPFRNDRILYMGVGIGGTSQLSPGVANAPPLLTDYPGTNANTDTDPTVDRLERPVRVSIGGPYVPGGPPYQPTDVWLAKVQAPPVFPTSTQVTFSRLFTETDISYLPYLVVPLSEVMLFTQAANPNMYNNTGVAYDTFSTLNKTTAFQLEVDWTVRF